MTLEIALEKRDEKLNNDAVRAADKIPVVYYGGGKDSTQGVVNYNDFVKMYREAGESTMITLKTPAGDEQALVQDFQLDPVSGKVLHVDFKIIEAGKPIEVTVPLEFIGASPAVSNGLGTLTKAMTEINIKVLPKDLPSHIDVNIESLETMEDQILVKDLQVPATVELLVEEDAAVAVVSAIKEESEDEASGEIDFDSIEVEKKGKDEEAAEDSAE